MGESGICNAPKSVLIVEDDPDSRALLERWLIGSDFETTTCESAEEALEALTRHLFAAVCLDLELPGINGIEALQRIKKRHSDLPVLILTANREVETVVESMRLGAADFLTKPLDKTRVLTTLQNAIERHRLELRVNELERQVTGTGYSSLIGKSPVMLKLFQDLDRVSARDITVLIRGESGTGKELVAKAIHEHSARKNGAFVALNCAAIAENLQESEFFGHEKGAFTGATARRIGRFEQANNGTLFLDEVADLSSSLQAKLLRALQEKCFRRVGGNTEIHSDFRLITASHKGLREEIAAGRFREDLYFRLAVFELEIPPLRDRSEDILRLASHFLSEFSPEIPVEIAPDAADVLLGYSWPGNVRELRNAIERTVVLQRNPGEITAADLPHIQRRTRRTSSVPAARIPVTVSSDLRAPYERSETRLNLEEVEKRALIAALEQANGNVSEATRTLGIGRTTVYRKLRKYGIRYKS